MDEQEKVRRAYRVVGRVQGVGFRWWTRRTATALGLDGWVRNEPDGSVVVHFSGAGDAVARLEEALRAGPPAARVERLEPMNPAGAFPAGEFRIES